MVALNSDDSVRRQNKGEDRPIVGLNDRMDVLAALHAVDYLVAFDGDTPLQVIEAVSAHTRQLARRQETWLRSFSEIRSIDVCQPMDPEAVAERIENMLAVTD
jgi:tRNA A37 N6-isopentenylltransferase MiaA